MLSPRKAFAPAFLAAAFLSTVFADDLRYETSPEAKVQLHRNWQLQSSCEAQAAGAEISRAGFHTTNWHLAQVPTTVVAALVADKTYADPYYGMNLKSFPGMNYSSATFFANQSIPEDSPFHCSWWFRTEFATPPRSGKRATWLHFDAINYRTNVWLNGQKISDSQDMAGTYRLFELEVGKYLLTGKTNALAVEVFAPDKNDLGMTWVDWNPTPADKDMGLWKDVYLTTSGTVSLRHPFVTSKLGGDYQSAALTLSAELRNTSDHPVTCTLRARVEGIQVATKIELAAGEIKTVTLAPQENSQLQIKHPRLWWPYQMGTPAMYTASFEVETQGRISDSAKTDFGIREVTSQFTDKGHRLFRVNGRKVLIRGAAWTPDMLLRWSPKQAAAALEYTRDMGLNAIRLEGRMERDEFFSMADHMGILIMPGWTCCDMWEHWPEWTAEIKAIAAASLSDQLMRLRNHPSVFVWLYGSDNPPPPDVETMYLQILKNKSWPNPSVSSASEQPTTVTGPSGVKMTGPYDYVPPNYWLADTQAGGAYGFNTETGPGPAIPTLESLKKFIPPDHLWPIDEFWNYHAGGERFTTLDRFLTGMNNRYGKPENIDDFERKAQAMNYEAQRAMFEAYARNKYISTGVIQWMLNNAWPSLIWHLYDYYLTPAGGYFGTKKACEPLHVQYSYDDNSVTVINGKSKPMTGLKVSAKIYDVDAREKFSREVNIDASADSSARALELPSADFLPAAYFLKLQLRDAHEQLLSDNFYWLSSKPDVLDWEKKQDTVYTPQSAYADLTSLASLSEVHIVSRASLVKTGDRSELRAVIKNPTSRIAFMVHLRAVDIQTKEDLVPIFWEDNYISLLPGETREVIAKSDFLRIAHNIELALDGWNIAPASVPLSYIK